MSLTEKLKSKFEKFDEEVGHIKKTKDELESLGKLEEDISQQLIDDLNKQIDEIEFDKDDLEKGSRKFILKLPESYFKYNSDIKKYAYSTNKIVEDLWENYQNKKIDEQIEMFEVETGFSSNSRNGCLFDYCVLFTFCKYCLDQGFRMKDLVLVVDGKHIKDENNKIQFVAISGNYEVEYNYEI